jgi:hypothetical protein
LHEAWLCCGRRAGKSFIFATIAVFLAAFKDWRPHLAAGEHATVMVIAADRRQARVIMRYCLGLLRAVPMLRQLIVGQTAESVSLRNRIVIEVHTASFRSTRGYTVVAALLDELAFWATDEASSSPDVEVLNAIRPAMSTVPGAMLLCASSPHARKGALWTNFNKHYGKEGDPILIWRATTREMNASVPQSLIDAALEEDTPRASAEYLAEFRTDVESFIAREAVEACVSPSVREVPPVGTVYYHAFVDPSGGSADSFTLAIAHNEFLQQTVVVDCVREVKPPFSPESVCSEFAKLLACYHCNHVVGDRYAGEWPREQFSKFGVRYEPSIKPKSELYSSLLPLINSGRIQLLDDARLINQLCSLERRTARGGKDSIDHPPHAHDDVANAVAGVAASCAALGGFNLFSGAWDDDDRAQRAARDYYAERQRKNPFGLDPEHYRRIIRPPLMMAREYVEAERRRKESIA